ncbi:MAG TPA: acetoacetate--CoA ligase [Solirubrobacterales bacterium]|jgi:acetoacetyl-CoA synthetase|nr:acetoacetate--CoA ligase [Solirubrobacterales bacterium]
MEKTPEILWRPTAAAVEASNLTAYIDWLRAERGVDVAAYPELWRWSVDDLEGFWNSIFDYFGVEYDGERGPALASREMPGADWFPGVRLNWAERAFAGKTDEQVAILHASELRDLGEITWGELRSQVAACAAGLRSLGVGQGDRVVAYLPNIAEATIAFLAVASIGAVWSSASPDFGAGSLIDRFAQIEPKVLIAVDGYRYGGKDFDRTPIVAQLQEAMPSVEHTVLLPYLDPGATATSGAAELENVVTWDDLLARGAGAELTFERVPFNHPLWVLYSSGTTGLPKAIVQGQGGILIEQLKKMHLHLDAKPGDRLFWFTTTGWMMWNFIVSGLLTEAAIVLYDGNPGFPDMGVLWDLAEEARITTFGTSAAYVSACMKAGVEPGAGRDLSRLRAVGSTGSPLAPEGFDWIYEHLGADTWLFSTSGGTDVCTAFVGGVPTLPVYRGELQARALGCKVEAWDEDGNSVVGEVGELVITEPMPSMPLYLWGDETGTRLRESYFEMFPGVWRHGDWIEITERGTAIIHGRSDSTINRGGIRIGTAEIYRAVLDSDDILDALVVDVPKPGTDGVIELFVVLRDGTDLDDDLRKTLARAIRERCSPRHVPDEVRAIAAVPRTLSGKVVEVPVKRILMGADPTKVVSRDSLANPDALDYFVELSDYDS